MPSGTVGTVTKYEERGVSYSSRFEFFVAWDNGVQTTRHNTSFRGHSWEYLTPPNHTKTGTLTMTVQDERITELFSSTSTEVINGIVPQVRYGDEIIWQGEPVPTTDSDGADISKAKQHEKALAVASEKTKEVVKGLFARP